MTLGYWRTLAAGMGLALALAPAGAAAETFHSSNVDSRLVLALEVNAEAAQAWMPEGWQVAPFGGGPFAGANLLLVMIDQHVGYDAEGTRAEPATRRAAALVIPGAGGAGDETRIFVTRIYSTAPGSSPYGNTLAAEVTHMALAEGATGGPRQARESWTVAPAEGGALTVTLQHAVGAQDWGAGEAQPYSSVTPDFHRIYRFQQLTELVMSAPLERPIDGTVSVSSTVPELAAMFDDSERLVAVVSIPVYAREIFLP